MPSCPQCSKPLAELTRQCPTCRADLDLLVDYVSGLQGSLMRAEQLTRAGELGQAVWAYLEVLEVDPDNPTARRQIGQIATAVRQFDSTAPGRRWAQSLAPSGEEGASFLRFFLKCALGFAVLLLLVGLGMFVAQCLPGGDDAAGGDKPEKPLPAKPDNKSSLSGK